MFSPGRCSQECSGRGVLGRIHFATAGGRGLCERHHRRENGYRTSPRASAGSNRLHKGRLEQCMGDSLSRCPEAQPRDAELSSFQKESNSMPERPGGIFTNPTLIELRQEISQYHWLRGAVTSFSALARRLRQS
ncbi:hypothetical protein AVEN_37624-1 [Araneus ventricosus]|uniref:Uncharacterized protein n=1 Tax=Araneus ventricosus TaxID=182803 RepID=A0A4Y2K0I6_ARAVE|nr:hypothetical protein AVEN_37624-1 [Araneus ventricosus]